MEEVETPNGQGGGLIPKASQSNDESQKVPIIDYCPVPSNVATLSGGKIFAWAAEGKEWAREKLAVFQIRMVLVLPDPDPLVTSTDPDQDPSLFALKC